MDKETEKIEILQNTEEYVLVKTRKGYAIFDRHDIDYRLSVGERLEDAIRFRIDFFPPATFKTEKRAISWFHRDPRVEEEAEIQSSNFVKEIKAGQYLFSPHSFNYIILRTKKGEGRIKLPQFTAKQDLLIDFIFGRLKKQVEAVPAENRAIVPYEDFDFAISNIDKLPTGFAGLSFTTTEVRKELNIKYPEKEMIEDFKKIRDGRIEATTVKVWAEEDGKYNRTTNWTGSIISDVVDLKTERTASKTGEPLYKIIMNIGLITGLLWRNDIIRKKYCLFPVDSDKRRNFGRLPEQAQKIFRYLSLWNETTLSLSQFSDILNYRPTGKQLRKFKARIDRYLGILEERDFIESQQRVKNTRSWKTQWYVRRAKLTITE